ncbi:MAG: lysylphosphatidylglycerol synthase domain-containing protein [Cyanobacteria bacterium P01_E01_bin.6]
MSKDNHSMRHRSDQRKNTAPIPPIAQTDDCHAPGKHRFRAVACLHKATQPWHQLFKRGLTLIPLCGAIALFIVSCGIIQRELKQYSLLDVWESFATTSPFIVGLAIACVILNYWVMTGYDTLAMRYVRVALPYRKTALASTISYAISNTVGATFLSGGALRYRFYKRWGLTSGQVAQVIAFCNLSFWLGLLTLGGVLFLTEQIDIATTLNLPSTSLRSLGLFSLLIVAAFLLVSSVMRRSLHLGALTVPRLSFPVAIAQIGITCCDWAIAASTISVLLGLSSSQELLKMIGVYVIAQMAGVLSSIPGGIGVFETVMVLLLSPAIPTIDLLGALVVFRVLHHLGPMVLAIIALIGYEARGLTRSSQNNAES